MSSNADILDIPVVNDIDEKEVASTQADEAARKAQLFKERIDERMTRLKEAGNRSLESATKTTQAAVAAGDQYVRNNPWSAVAIASGAAVLVGLLLGRRR